MTFIFKLTKFRASTLGKLKEGQKNGQNGTLVHCLAPNSELIFDFKKLARNLDDYMKVITIETVKHYGKIKLKS